MAQFATVTSSRLLGRSAQAAVVVARRHGASASQEKVQSIFEQSNPDIAKSPSIKSKGISAEPTVSKINKIFKDSIMAGRRLGKEPVSLSLADLQKLVWGVEYVRDPWKHQTKP